MTARAKKLARNYVLFLVVALVVGLALSELL